MVNAFGGDVQGEIADVGDCRFVRFALSHHAGHGSVVGLLAAALLATHDDRY